MLKVNEGRYDRIARVIIGAGLVGSAYMLSINWLYIVGAVLIITGAVGFCGLYALFGINTCPVKK